MEANDLDDPVRKAKLVGLLLKLTPFMFAFCYFLAWVQGAQTNISLVIAGVGAALCAGAAIAIQLLGSKSWIALVLLKVAILVTMKR